MELNKHDSIVDILHKELGISKILAKLLVNRGIDTVESAKKFLKPNLNDLIDPKLFPTEGNPVSSVADAILSEDKLCIYGDYDLDGISSTAVLSSFFRDINANFMYHIPDRAKDGYALNKKTIDLLKQQGVKTIVTVDCGITNINEAKYAREQGINLVITDHHEPQEILPDVNGIFNPKLDSNSELSILAGVGVAFYFIIALRRELRSRGVDISVNIKKYLWLVSFGTIADIVPLLGVNRIFVYYGLQIINTGKVLAINLLAEKDSRIVVGEITSTVISFLIAPKLNAAGRMSTPIPVLELFLTNNIDEGRKIIELLEQLNKDRIKVQNSAVNFIENNLDSTYKGIPLYYDESFHQGVIGIVASRFAKNLERPVVVCANDESNKLIKCSMRSFANFNLIPLIEKLKPLLLEHGGHKGAAGFSCKRELLGEIREFLSNYNYNSELVNDTDDFLYVDTSEITEDLVKELSLLEPYGSHNPKPLFKTKIKIKTKKILKDKHIKLRTQDNLDVIGFNLYSDNLSISSDMSIIFYLEFNKWNGIRKTQLNMVGLE